jgi:hypothetical protein
MALQLRRLLGCAAVGAIVLLAAPAAAPAAKIGTDGTIHACYKAKGKPKGAVRVVRAGKPCKRKRGERPLSWSVAPTGGGTVSNDNVYALLGYIQQQQTEIVSLQTQLEAVEGVLDGVTNGELTGAISKLEGITGTELGDAVAAVPSVAALCTHVSTVTTQVDALRTVISGLGLNGVLTGLGGVLNIPALPAALGAFSCPPA